MIADSRVINNPFEMSRLKKSDVIDIRQKYRNISECKIVILIAGRIHENKGVLFAIEVFNTLKRKDMQLVIAGAGSSRYVEKCKAKAANNANIVFIGEQNDMGDIYILSDYLLRCDNYFCTGRTVYEALYSGCNVIMQIDCETDKKEVDEFDRFSEKIFFYQSRNPESLRLCMESLPQRKIENRRYLSNVSQYIEAINGFIFDED